MARNSLFRICGTATAAIFLLASNVASPAQQQKSPKELITGNWSLMIADHVRGEVTDRAGAQNILDTVAPANASRNLDDYIDTSLSDALRAQGFFAAMEMKYGKK